MKLQHFLLVILITTASIASAKGAIVSGVFHVAIDTGLLAGSTHDGTFSYDDSDISGVGNEFLGNGVAPGTSSLFGTVTLFRSTATWAMRPASTLQTEIFPESNTFWDGNNRRQTFTYLLAHSYMKALRISPTGAVSFRIASCPSLNRSTSPLWRSPLRPSTASM